MEKEIVEVKVQEGLIRLLNSRHAFELFCNEKRYGFGFEGKNWVDQGGWRIKSGEAEFHRKDVKYEGEHIGSGLDSLGRYKSVTFKWRGKIEVELTFKVYEEPYVVFQVKANGLETQKRLDIDFPMFVDPSKFASELYLSAIVSAYPAVWPMIKIFKPADALEEFSASFDDGTEFLPLWIYDEKRSIVVMPIDNFVDYRVVNVRDQDGKGFSMRLSGLNEGKSVEASTLIFYSDGGPSETLIEAGEVLKKIYGRTPVNSDVYSQKYLGYSTANGSYYFNRFDEKTILDVKKHLEDVGIPARWMQLDVMWYRSSIPTRIARTIMKLAQGRFSSPLEDTREILKFINAVWGTKEMAPDREVFPNEFKNMGMPVGVWIWTTRFDPETPYSLRYPWIAEANLPRTKEFWLDIARDFKSHNIVWVETDNLCDILGREGLEAIGQKEKWLIDVIESFMEYNIPVQMCMTPGKLYPVALKTRNAYFMRTGGDFRMHSDSSLIYQNFYNSALAWAFGLYPCFDVFFTSDASYAKCDEVKAEEWGLPLPYITLKDANMASAVLAHALSCGITYIGDGMGLIDKKTIMSLCLSNGELIHPDRPAVPIKSCYHLDPIKDSYPLIVYTTCGNNVLLGIFNLSDEEEKYSLPLEELKASNAYYAFEYYSHEVQFAEKKISGVILPKACKLYIMCPILGDSGVIGDLEKVVTPYVIEDVQKDEGLLSVDVKASDRIRLGIVCRRPEKVLVNGSVCMEWKHEDKLLEVSLGSGKHRVQVK